MNIPPLALGTIVALLVIALIATLVIFLHDIGKITLSNQSLTHRRNVLFAFCLILLAEIFSVDIPAQLNLKTRTEPVASEQVRQENSLNTYAYGLIGFFLIYSFIEYTFTLSSDYLKSRNEWRDKNKETKFRRDIAVLVIGIYRAIFDIVLPILALCFVLTFLLEPTKNFLVKAKEAITCRYTDIEQLPSTTQTNFDKALGAITEICPKCDPNVAETISTFCQRVIATAEDGQWFRCPKKRNSQ